MWEESGWGPYKLDPAPSSRKRSGESSGGCCWCYKTGPEWRRSVPPNLERGVELEETWVLAGPRDFRLVEI